MSCALSYFNIIGDANMVHRVRKNWKERITWKFWETHKIVPQKTFMVIDSERLIVCHPSMLEIVEDHIESLI